MINEIILVSAGFLAGFSITYGYLVSKGRLKDA